MKGFTCKLAPVYGIHSALTLEGRVLRSASAMAVLHCQHLLCFVSGTASGVPTDMPMRLGSGDTNPSCLTM